MVMIASAAMAAAAALFQVRLVWHAAQFESLAHELVDGLMHVMHFFLRFEETAGDGIAQERLTFFFKRGNFRPGQLLRALLLLLESLALGHERFVLRAGFFVSDESFDTLARRPHGGFIQNSLAEFPGLFGNQTVLSRLHNLGLV